jgi:hypothetical protein
MIVLQGACDISWHLCVMAQHLHLLKVAESLQSREPAADSLQGAVSRGTCVVLSMAVQTQGGSFLPADEDESLGSGQGQALAQWARVCWCRWTLLMDSIVWTLPQDT